MSIINEEGQTKCNGSGCDRKSEILMMGYAGDEGDGENIELCRYCALQLVRKLSEDLCELIDGNRYR
jgi:hypothetical protein